MKVSLFEMYFLVVMLLRYTFIEKFQVSLKLYFPHAGTSLFDLFAPIWLDF
jgi:hypothetical protein